jgi:type II secretory pathway component PulK
MWLLAVMSAVASKMVERQLTLLRRELPLVNANSYKFTSDAIEKCNKEELYTKYKNESVLN